jgi:hypothetical protein
VSGFRWDVPPEQAFPEMAQAYMSAIHMGVFSIIQRWAPEIENWMKQNAPWTDRTGNARQTLHTEIDDVVNTMVKLTLAHGVNYGIFLELCNAGRYAIVNPALDHFAPKIWSDVQRMLS